MAQALLVNIDIPQGAKVLNALDEAGVAPQVCAWAYLSGYEDWRLIIASRKLDAVGMREAYALIHKATGEAGMNAHTEPPLMVFRMTDPLIRDLRRIFGKTADVTGMRIGGQSFGERFIADGYVYRIR